MAQILLCQLFTWALVQADFISIRQLYHLYKGKNWSFVLFCFFPAASFFTSLTPNIHLKLYICLIDVAVPRSIIDIKSLKGKWYFLSLIQHSQQSINMAGKQWFHSKFTVTAYGVAVLPISVLLYEMSGMLRVYCICIICILCCEIHWNYIYI